MTLYITTYHHADIHLLLIVRCTTPTQTIEATKKSSNTALDLMATLCAIAHYEPLANEFTESTKVTQPNSDPDPDPDHEMITKTKTEATRAWLEQLKIHNTAIKKRLLQNDVVFIKQPKQIEQIVPQAQEADSQTHICQTQMASKLLDLTICQLDDYFAGSRQSFDLPLDMNHGTPFQRQVWQTLQAIEYGQTITYAELAEQVGNAKAVRAVANANGKNVFSLVIPCHRVIASDGGLGGYTGGVEKKQYLLNLEQKVTNKQDLHLASERASNVPSLKTHLHTHRIHIVLVHPDIPNNTGNIIRLCANTGAMLHLVKPLGFELDDKKLRRAGLDYHEYANLQVHDNWQLAKNSLSKFNCHVRVGLTTKLSRPFYDHNFIKNVSEEGDDNESNSIKSSNIALIFGSETKGLPETVRADIGEDNWLRLPMLPHSRSLNLSNSVAICLYEVWRQLGFIGDEGKSEGYDMPNHLMQN